MGGKEESKPLFLRLTKEIAENFQPEPFEKAIPKDQIKNVDSAFRKASEASDVGKFDKIALSAISDACSIYQKSEIGEPPFGPMIILEGKRSADVEDFREYQEAISIISRKLQNLFARARLSDIAWLLNKSDVEASKTAVEAYLEMTTALWNGTTFPERRGDLSIASIEALNFLGRALSITRKTGWEKKLAKKVRALTIRVRRACLRSYLDGFSLSYVKLDRDFGISDPKNLIRDIQTAVERHKAKATDPFLKADALAIMISIAEKTKNADLATSLKHRRADLFEEAGRAVIENGSSAMIAAMHFIHAIDALHSVANAKERRMNLKKSLESVQTEIPNEFSKFETKWDLREYAGRGIFEIQSTDTLDKALEKFAFLSDLPSSEKLNDDARESVKQYPFQRLFSTAHLDRTGRTRHVSDSLDLKSNPSTESFLGVIQQGEHCRRITVGCGIAEAARQEIWSKYKPSLAEIISYFERSPFVPPHQIQTISSGFLDFLRGDFRNAVVTAILAIEAIFRRALSVHGHQVSSRNDTDGTQKYLSLNEIIKQKKAEIIAIFGENIVYDIERLMTSRPGPTLRHDLAHGEFSDFQEYSSDAKYACWAVYRLCIIGTLIVDWRDGSQ